MADEGMNRLANVLHGRIAGHQQAYSDLVIDTGTIQGDMSLLTDSYPIPIPQTDYYVNLLLTLGDTGSWLTDTNVRIFGDHTHSGCGYGSGHSDGTHKHDVQIPEKMRWLKPGDRVLVAWVNHDAFVIMRFVPATEIG